MAVASITEWFIPDGVRQSQDQLIRARTVVSVALLAGLISPLFALSYFKLHHPAMGTGIVLGGAGLLLGALMLKLTGMLRLTAEFILLCMYAMVSWMVYVNGGIMSTSVLWYASIPMAAVFVGGRVSGYVWTALTFVAVALFFIVSSEPGWLPASPIHHEEIPKLQAKSLLGLTLVVLSLALSFERAKSRGFEKLEAAREESERATLALKEMMLQVNRSLAAATQESRQIADSTQTMARTMSDQRERAEDMVVVAQQMAVVTSQNAEQSTSATDMARQAGNAANLGGEAMNAAVSQLNQARSVINHAAERLEELGQRSSEVNSIVQMIRDIADQTNLLALNAAIEAARAGEFGRGFAVVADEVRKLAERTQKATLEIEGKIQLIVDSTDQALVAMRDGNAQMRAGREHTVTAQERLAGIIDSTRQLNEVLVQVSQAEQTQNKGFAQFAGDITAVGDSTRELSSRTEAIAQATRRLDQLMAELDSAAQHFAQQQAAAHTPRSEPVATLRPAYA